MSYNNVTMIMPQKKASRKDLSSKDGERAGVYAPSIFFLPPAAITVPCGNIRVLSDCCGQDAWFTGV